MTRSIHMLFVVLSGIICLISNKLAARVVIIGYTCKSGTNFFDQVNFVGKAVVYVHNVYRSILFEEKTALHCLILFIKKENILL